MLGLSIRGRHLLISCYYFMIYRRITDGKTNCVDLYAPRTLTHADVGTLTDLNVRSDLDDPPDLP